MQNKDYIINLRVSRDLYDKIKRKAHENQDSISNLVRKAIDDSVEIFDDLSKEFRGEGKATQKDIIGYQWYRAARDVPCDTCGASIEEGQTYLVGETRGSKKYIFCDTC